MSMNRRSELVQALRAMAELARLRAPRLEGAEATTLDCSKCGVLGCQTINADA